MSFRTSLKRNNTKTRKQIDNLSKLNKSFVESGHFASQGSHGSAGMSYVDLMKLHHNGGGGERESFPVRSPLDILDGLRAQGILSQKSLESAAKAILLGEDNPSEILDIIGRELVKQEKAIFGSSALISNSPLTIALKGRDEPLVDTGELKNKVAYKTSVGNRVVEG